MTYSATSTPNSVEKLLNAYKGISQFVDVTKYSKLKSRNLDEP
jgi:hypothetical protein